CTISWRATERFSRFRTITAFPINFRAVRYCFSKYYLWRPQDAVNSGTKRAKANTKPAKNYRHPESESLMRPEVGTQAQFKKKLPPKKYRYDDSLSPGLEWDGQNPAREHGEALIRQVLQSKSLEEAKAAVSKLKAMSKPFLNWARAKPSGCHSMSHAAIVHLRAALD